MSFFQKESKGNNLNYRFIFVLISLSVLLLGIVVSLFIGSMDMSWNEVVKSIFSADNSKNALVVRTIRLPRVIMAAFIGANLAVAGVLMQGITRNPLAFPQIFGINSGASFFVVTAVVFFSNMAEHSLVPFAFVGAALSGGLVYFMGSIGGMTPVKLALAGMAIHFLLSSFTQGLILLNENSLDKIMHWVAGSISGSSWESVLVIFPWTFIGLCVALLLAPSMTILDLGEDIARGLGQKTGYIRLFAGIIVIVLAGAAVAVAGPIGFIGLIVPHIVKHLVGADYRLQIPFCALFGAILLVYADIISRFIAYPFESPVGIVTAAIGGPFFLYLAQKNKGVQK